MKYNVRFCKCGHIHLINDSWFDWMREDYKNNAVIFVCQSCGATHKIFLDTCEDGFSVNVVEMKNFQMNGGTNTKFIFSEGIGVPLEVGEYASFYANHRWYYGSGSSPVDTERLIRDVQREYKDEADEILKSISCYVSGIDWKGTKYEVT